MTRHAPPRGRNGVLIAARPRLRQVVPVNPHVEEPWRLLDAVIGRLRLTGVYMPNLRVKIPYWEALIQALSVPADEPALALGDFNPCRAFMDEAGATDRTARFLDDVQDAGFRDVWRDRNPDGRECSWYSTRGNEFRIDHAFLSPRLVGRTVDIRYSHDARHAGVSDHSMLVIDLQ
jgi:exodeoxyribonuclease-3